MALRSHLLSVDKLIDLHNARLKDAEAEFERDMQILADEFGEERREMEATRARNVPPQKDSSGRFVHAPPLPISARVWIDIGAA